MHTYPFSNAFQLNCQTQPNILATCPPWTLRQQYSMMRLYLPVVLSSPFSHLYHQFDISSVQQFAFFCLLARIFDCLFVYSPHSIFRQSILQFNSHSPKPAVFVGFVLFIFVLKWVVKLCVIYFKLRNANVRIRVLLVKTLSEFLSH